jgi:hypothetical protein
MLMCKLLRLYALGFTLNPKTHCSHKVRLLTRDVQLSGCKRLSFEDQLCGS